MGGLGEDEQSFFKDSILGIGYHNHTLWERPLVLGLLS